MHFREKRPETKSSRSLARARDGPPLRRQQVEEEEEPPRAQRDGQRDDPVRGSYTARLDKFYGEERENFDERLFQINAVGDLEQWNRRARLRQAVAFLRGRAQAEYRALIADLDGEVGWDDFREFMQRTFGPQNPLQHYTRALVANRQGKQESVMAYSSRFRNVSLKLQSIDRDAHSAAAIVLWYTEGLRSELQAELERDTPETLAEAVKSAEKAERVWKRKQGSRLGGADGYPIVATTVPESTERDDCLRQMVEQQGKIIQLLQKKTVESVIAAVNTGR